MAINVLINFERLDAYLDNFIGLILILRIVIKLIFIAVESLFINYLIKVIKIILIINIIVILGLSIFVILYFGKIGFLLL